MSNPGSQRGSWLGLRSPPRYALDLVIVYGGGPASLLRKVRVPYALPALFASARVAGPSALLGAVVAEWLATGQGLGYQMVQAADSSQFTFLWAGVVVLTVFAFLVYNLVAVIERPVLSRFSI